MPIFDTMAVTITHSNGQVVAQHLPIQMDTVNLDWLMQAQGLTPVDQYDVFSLGWTTPQPLRSDYLVDEATGTKYSMCSTVFVATNSLQFRVTKYSGVTP